MMNSYSVINIWIRFNQQVQSAAYQAIAVSAEGCQEHIRNK